MRALRKFADVLRAFVYCFQKRVQSLRERNIARAAPESAGFLKIRLAKSAHRTLLCRCSFLDFLGGPDPKKQIGERKPSGILHALFFRASVAEIHLLHFAFQYLSQEDCGIIAFANVAQHFF
jgi:hypothetical protein